MLIPLLLTLLAAVSSVFAEVAHNSHKSSRVCRNQLEVVVFQPPVCALEYLRKISRVLEAQSPLLFSDDNQLYSVIATFEARYKVVVALVDAFGNVFLSNDLVTPLSVANVATANVDRAWALGEGFSAFESARDADFPFFAYSFNVWNNDGEMWTINIIMSKANAPSAC